MTPIPRRKFLATTAATAAALSSSRLSAEAPASPQPLRIGLLGCGWWGLLDAKAALQAGGCEIVAICDVDREHLDRAAEEFEKAQGSRPATFADDAKLLAFEGLDILILATPPHWHALPFIEACRRKLDIYCEKPLAYDIREGQAMVEAAKQAGNIVQIGFQRRQSTGFSGAREFIRSGKAGRIGSVEAQINVPLQTEDRTPIEPPASLDWDRWCGPAPLLPYSKAVGHFHWRQEKTTGNGHLVDWGIHLIDAARWILNAGTPVHVQSTGGLYHLGKHITTPDLLTSHFEFADFPLTWRHRAWGARDFHRETANGLFLYGEDATVFCTDDRWILQPRERGAEEQVHEAKNDSLGLHMVEFLKAVRSRGTVSCPIEDGHASTVAVNLAMISYETASKITWDPASGEILNEAKAAALLKREYREPWVHPHQA